MQEELGQNFQGVVIPQSAIEASNAAKAKRERTLAQLPVFRTASNLLFVVTGVVKGGPRPLRRFYDGMLADVTEIMKAVGMADASRNPDDRVWYIDSALVLTYVVRQQHLVLHRLGLIEKDADKKMKGLVKSMIAQLVGWRDYTRSGGAVPSVERLNDAEK
ncbi:MAG: hypothetical protein J5951_05910 [Bacteroidales bacterium]|nr:hypothetical protein [Bacteroidales bacterium]